ncbi:hypothetical protein Uis1B_0771 [Bifidobacterium margollesii]|uniref:Uncharacterized protein n=1 Tax=Bifidobacterium margollesii TaxID=2020964 RepID=A0A2N5JB46_9BIFI|nr:hypothetical protein [Bifidobacterium margollesii]PLS31430.1 hypothetical protein Uis1B_0771 [Bifidobacterium margollesii]
MIRESGAPRDLQVGAVGVSPLTFIGEDADGTAEIIGVSAVAAW